MPDWDHLGLAIERDLGCLLGAIFVLLPAVVVLGACLLLR